MPVHARGGLTLTKVFTPNASWTGSAVATPARLSVEISPYSESGRNITFICNGEPVYYLEGTTALPDAEFRLFLYGYGNSVSSWDYADAYPVQSWSKAGAYAWGNIAQEQADDAVSGKYMTHISIDERENGSMGIAHCQAQIIYKMYGRIVYSCKSL